MRNVLLKRNPDAGYYECTVTLQVEEEIFRLALFRYIEEKNLDLTDIGVWERAIGEVANANRWLNHPRTQVQLREYEPEPDLLDHAAPASSPPSLAEVARPSEMERLTDELRERARHLAVDEWEAQLLTPLLATGASRQERKPVYYRREKEKIALARLREELQQGTFSLDADVISHQEQRLTNKVQAIAEVVNGNRI